MNVKMLSKWALFVALALMLASCGGYSAKQKKDIEKWMLDHLVNKYNQEFSVTITGNLHYASLGNPFGGGISGLKAEAYPLGEETKKFEVHYNEREGTIYDGYSTIFMTERAEQILSETLNAAYTDPIKYDIDTFAGPFGVLPSNEFTQESELSEYTESFDIEVYVKKILNPDEYHDAAEKIDFIQNELIQRGVKNFFITIVYLNDYNHDNIDHVLAALNRYYGSAFEIDDIYSYCRLLDDCKITASIAKKGELQNDKESIEEGFTNYREPDETKLKKLPYLLQDIETRVRYGGNMQIDRAVELGYTVLKDATIEKNIKSYGKSRIYNGYDVVDGIKRHRIILTDLHGDFLFDHIVEPVPIEFVDVREVDVKDKKGYNETTIAVVADYLDEHHNTVTKSSVMLISNRELEIYPLLNEELNRRGITSLDEIFAFVHENSDEFWKEAIRFR